MLPPERPGQRPSKAMSPSGATATRPSIGCRATVIDFIALPGRSTVPVIRSRSIRQTYRPRGNVSLSIAVPPSGTRAPKRTPWVETAVSWFGRIFSISTASVSPGSAPSIAIGPTSPGHFPPAFSYHSPHRLSLSRTSPGFTVRTGGRTANVGYPTVGLKWWVSALATEAASVRPQSARSMDTSDRTKRGDSTPLSFRARFVPALRPPGGRMNKERPADATFGSIEGAAEYLGLLIESVNEAREDLESETALASAPGMERRQQAIQLATYKLSQLKQHLATSHRLLNDLRTIRRLLFAERQVSAFDSAAGTAPGQFVTTA